MHPSVFPPRVRHWLRVAFTLSGGPAFKVDKVGPSQRTLLDREMQVLVVKDRWGHHMIKAKGTQGLEWQNKWGGMSLTCDGKESACSAGGLGSLLGPGRVPAEGNGYPLQYSCLENSMDREVWWAIVCEESVAKSQT